jgi:hypothetical protein
VNNGLDRVSVHSTGPAWFRTLMHVCRVPIFRRVHSVSLRGPQYGTDLLLHLSRLRDLRELELTSTSISSRDLEAWEQRHPSVAVRVDGP